MSHRALELVRGHLHAGALARGAKVGAANSSRKDAHHHSTRKESIRMGQQDAAPRPQHLEALERANEVRRRLYAIRRTVVNRRVSLAAVILPRRLEHADAELVDARPVIEVLKWGWRIGPTVARRIMNTADIAPTATLKVGDLAPSRREALVGALEALAPDALEGTRELEAIAEAIRLEATRPDTAATAAA